VGKNFAVLDISLIFEKNCGGVGPYKKSMEKKTRTAKFLATLGFNATFSNISGISWRSEGLKTGPN
jgi:hypothetical protein